MQANSAACNENVLTTQVTQSMEATHSGQFTQAKRMSVSASDSNISCLPRATLEDMWNKAEEYLQLSVDVVAAPGGDPKSKMVTSRSGSFPHWVQIASPGQ